jgi:hypothetical protein
MRNHPITVILLCLAIIGCFGKGQRKSGDYYAKNEATLHHIRNIYDSLYAKQAFSIGYTDKSFRYYFVEFTTDSVRYVYNNESSADSLNNAITKFGYEHSQFMRLVMLMKQAECLWLDKVRRFLDNEPVYFTYLSFGSVLTEKPFVENKYYVLIFPKGNINKEALKQRISRGGLVPINDSVYFTISNRFR